MVTPDRGRAQGRAARGPELDRLRARERDRLPHLHGGGARPVRGAVLQLAARTNAEGPTPRAPYLAEGRVPGLTRSGRQVRPYSERMFPSYYIVGALQLAKADAARVGLGIEHGLDADDEVEPPRGGLPRLTTIEVRPEEVGPGGVRLDEASRAKLAAAGVD